MLAWCFARIGRPSIEQYRKRGTHSRFRPALSGDNSMTMREVVIREVPPMEILSVDHTGPYMQIGKAFDELFRWLAAHNLLAPELRMIGIYYDDPVQSMNRHCARRLVCCCLRASSGLLR
jgi:hypothetical protein